MPKPWDDVMKQLARKNPQSFVSFALEDAQFVSEVDRELKADPVEADLLYNVIWHGKEVILHIEFQKRRDPEMGRRVWQYNAMTDCLVNKPVYSVVIYLRPDGNPLAGSYQRELPNGEIIHSFCYRVIKLWELSAEALLEPGLEGLLPLLPLTADGGEVKIIERVVARLQAVGKVDLLSLCMTVAGLVFSSDADHQWLVERFRGMDEILEESWVYQEIKQKGVREGREEERVEERKRVITTFVKMRYPDLLDLAQQRVASMTEAEDLEALENAIFAARTSEEVRAALVRNEQA